MARNFPGAAGGNDYGAANKGGSASPGGVTSTACAAGDTTCQLAQAFSQLAGQGAPVQASPTSDAQPTVVPTQTGGTTNPLPAFILLGAAIGAGFWYYEKHKHAAGK
jgi:hypothetical protein